MIEGRDLDLDIPEKLTFFANEFFRYKIAYGGRGAAKSWSIARILIAKALKSKITVLCTREHQNSIGDSVHALLIKMIGLMDVDSYFHATKNGIINIENGSIFRFKGLRKNPKDVKSMEDLDFVWVEEGEQTSEESWKVLYPTLRNKGSELWIVFNTGKSTDYIYNLFINR